MALFWILVPIALVDSLSVAPLCLLPLAAIMAGKRPFVGAFLLLFGIFIVYFPFGILIALGLDALLEKFGDYLSELWYHPTKLQLGVQIVIGFLLVVFGFKTVDHRGEKKAHQKMNGITGFQAFSIGAAMTAFGLWGALPYFAAIEQILRADLSTTATLLYLLWYNVLFIMPLVVLLVVGLLMHKEYSALFSKIEHIFDTWGSRVVIALMVLIGVFLILDGGYNILSGGVGV